MDFYSTDEAASRIGLSVTSLKRYIAAKKVPLPPARAHIRARLWSDEDIQRVREVLPKIANGRKTRYSKKRSAVSVQQSVKTKKKKKK